MSWSAERRALHDRLLLQALAAPLRSQAALFNFLATMERREILARIEALEPSHGEEPRSAREVRTGSTVDAAAELGCSRDTLDRRLKALRDAGIELGSMPGAPQQVGQGGSRRHLRWDLERVAEFWAASERALEKPKASKGALARRSSRRGPRSGKRYGPSDGRSLLARVKDARPRGG